MHVSLVYIINIILLINITLIGGILPLIERKYLSLIQRRVGPTVVGYKGRLQFIADALKMFLKGCIVPNKINVLVYYFFPSLFVSIVYLFWLNIYWNINTIFFELEYNILYTTILSLIMNFIIIMIGYFGLNKYALLAALRNLCVMFCLELLLGLMFLTVMFISNSFNFTFLIILQQEYPLIILFSALFSVILITSLIEINRSPFDLSEAESELVSGFHVEYGAFFFGLFYLGEYFHLFFFSIVLLIVYVSF